MKNSQQLESTMSCAEFQEQLPELFASGNGGVPSDPNLQAHLDTCENCSALVRDLQYIADQARMLLEPAQDEPSDDVWSNIQSKLKSEQAESGFGTPPPLPS
jgi:hypothetical protein